MKKANRPIETTAVEPVEQVTVNRDPTSLDEQERRTMLRLLQEHRNTITGMQNGIPELTVLADLDNRNPSAQAQQARKQLNNYATQISVNQKHAADLERQLDAAGEKYDRSTLERHGAKTVQPNRQR